jgi:hypothetical protein
MEITPEVRLLTSRNTAQEVVSRASTLHPLLAQLATELKVPLVSQKKCRPAYRQAALKPIHFDDYSGRQDTPQAKPAFSSLDRLSVVPTAGSWAVRLSLAASAALTDSAGFVFAPIRVSADRYVVGCGLLDLTFRFSLCVFIW